jgi:hypothetical protein
MTMNTSHPKAGGWVYQLALLVTFSSYLDTMGLD